MVDITGIFGDYAAFAPIIILAISALLLPAVQFIGKRRTATWAFALVLTVISMIVNGIMLTDNFVGDAMGLYEYNAYTGLMILLFRSSCFWPCWSPTPAPRRPGSTSGPTTLC